MNYANVTFTVLEDAASARTFKAYEGKDLNEAMAQVERSRLRMAAKGGGMVTAFVTDTAGYNTALLAEEV